MLLATVALVFLFPDNVFLQRLSNVFSGRDTSFKGRTYDAFYLGKDIETTVEVKQADTNYFALYNMKLAAGRNLLASDTTKEYVINETYARFLGYPDPSKIVGESIDRSGRLIPIVGVIRDFNSKSLHKQIAPLAFTANQQTDHFFHILLGGKNTGQWRNTIGRRGLKSLSAARTRAWMRLS